tara:strand:+ start:2253 stop:2741 length:489 start_codon:yes stop_codon:yes gene_type:complete
MKTKTILREAQASSDTTGFIAKVTGWNYCGDINPEHGGYFWKWTDRAHTSAELVEIVDCTNDGMGERNRMMEGDIDLPTDEEEIRSSLQICGWGSAFDKEGNLKMIWQNGDEITDPETLKVVLLESHYATWGGGGHEGRDIYADRLLTTIIRRLKNQRPLKQ